MGNVHEYIIIGRAKHKKVNALPSAWSGLIPRPKFSVWETKPSQSLFLFLHTSQAIFYFTPGMYS